MSNLLSQQLDTIASDHFRLMQLVGTILPAVDFYLESRDDPGIAKARDALRAYAHLYYGDYS